MMKLNAGNVSVWALVASLALAGILFGKSATSVFATCSQGFHWNGQQCVPNEVEVDECNEEFTYDNQVDDNRVLIDTINTGASGNPDSITVTAKSGYQVIGVDNDMRSYFFGGSLSVSALNPSLRSKQSHSSPSSLHMSLVV